MMIWGTSGRPAAPMNTQKLYLFFHPSTRNRNMVHSAGVHASSQISGCQFRPFASPELQLGFVPALLRKCTLFFPPITAVYRACLI
jgi:hypothetical protein